ncbi:NAD(P)-dependent oxidoreductase [Pseudoroseicyclus sp. CXY001]|uniref:NAD(P)-dependent oxidoreductase n=1 Tax=Pseudoroseicyclus sp. CXY001 TaxID=3242492 RepID=UPI00357146CD
MPNSMTPGLAAGRLGPDEIAGNFADLHPPLGTHEAQVAADRCYFCHDAPCVTACPTSIDIPLFIRQIASGRPEDAGKTIFEQNILGGMCARVCPTENLCEGACVREVAEGEPVQIGRLQRHATDGVMARQGHPFERAAATGKRVAVVGGGPAGLACAHRLAMKGHEVTVFEGKPKAGGLNEYGIAAYKTVDDFAAKEAQWLCGIGGISVETGRALGAGLSLDALAEEYDAVFLGIGLGGVNALTAPGVALAGIEPAVDFIERLRQAEDKAALPVGRNVVVIGGGMTAVDAAVQAKLLGAASVTLAYRKTREAMPASRWEQDLAASKGVQLVFQVTPAEMRGEGAVSEVVFAHAESDTPVILQADQVLLAIGQRLAGGEGLQIAGGKIAVTGAGRTSLAKVWAGGDCASGGDDLTVTAVAEGRDAAEDIHASLMGP